MKAIEKPLVAEKRRDFLDLATVLVTLYIGYFIVYFLAHKFEIGLTLPTRWEPQFALISWEFVFVGLVPLLLVLFRNEQWNEYGITSRNALRSFAYGVATLAAILVIVFLKFGGMRYTPSGVYDSLQVTSILRYPLAVYGALAYFPLEMFFFSYLIIKFEKVLGSKARVLTSGLMAACLFYGINHGTAAIAQGLDINVALMKFFVTIPEFLILGLIFKKTQSIIGPLVVWILINGLSF